MTGIPVISGASSSGANTRQAGLNVQIRPLTDALTSPVGKTFETRPT